jgi:predicted secreted protein
MNWYAIVAIYILFWVISAFMVLPVGLRTPHEAGEAVVSGNADSAPVNFRPVVVALRATILSAILFGLYYANYSEGWITAESMRAFMGVPR